MSGQARDLPCERPVNCLAFGASAAGPLLVSGHGEWSAHSDGTVSLTDLESGRDLCAPMLLPSPPISLATTRDGDLLVGAGSDVTRYHPLVAEPRSLSC